MHIFNRKPRVLSFLIVFLVISLWLWIELYSPREIICSPLRFENGVKILTGSDLIIQQVNNDDTLWAVRGRWIYKSSDGIKFKRMFKAPPYNDFKLLIADFRSLRLLTGFNEICEVFQLHSGTILIFSGGYIWRSGDNGKTFSLVHKLRHFGIGVGRGVMPQGMTEDSDGISYYGEYFSNPERGSVYIYRSRNDGKNWEVAHQFKPGEIRHIHSLQYDPYTGALWVTKGDRSHECMIGYSIDKGATFLELGSGNQDYRAVSLLFTRDAVFWGTDSASRQNYIFRWDRKTHEVKKICKVDGPIYYSTVLTDGTMAMVRTVEGGKGEWDDIVSIWTSKNGTEWKRIPIGLKRKSIRFGILRVPKGKPIERLYVSSLNVSIFKHKSNSEKVMRE